MRLEWVCGYVEEKKNASSILMEIVHLKPRIGGMIKLRMILVCEDRR
jgi:hypothetical protein